MGGSAIAARMRQELDQMRQAGTYKHLRTLTGASGPHVDVAGVGDILLLCANNYLGLAAHPEVIRGGQEALARYGAGPASVRFICGTLDIHQELEERLAQSTTVV